MNIKIANRIHDIFEKDLLLISDVLNDISFKSNYVWMLDDSIDELLYQFDIHVYWLQRTTDGSIYAKFNDDDE